MIIYTTKTTEMFSPFRAGAKAPNRCFCGISTILYGENFFEMKDTWQTPYKFNGKEKDEETGLYYYGARYYTPELSLWLNVDPLSDKYPSLSPFIYCAGNPIRLIDPDGRDIDGVTYDKKTKEFSYTHDAEERGTKAYINARMTTKSGQRGIMKMVHSKRTFTINITDKPMFVGNENGGLGRVLGYVDGDNLYFSTNYNKDLSNEEYANSMVISDKGFTQTSINRNSIFSGTATKDYTDAMRISGITKFESNINNGFKSSEQVLNGIGAHEETHLFQPGGMSFFDSELQALKNELYGRKEYLKNLKK